MVRLKPAFEMSILQNLYCRSNKMGSYLFDQTQDLHYRGLSYNGIKKLHSMKIAPSKTTFMRCTAKGIYIFMKR